MEKREFIKNAGAAALLLSLGISLESCSNEADDPQPNPNPGTSITIDLTDPDYSALQNNDGWVLDNTNFLLLVNIGGDISAFGSSCPHAGCSNSWQYSNQLFICTCHGSQFSNSGSRISGPAQSGLTKFTVTKDGNILTIT